MKIALISCVSQKRKGKYPAKHLYISPLFIKSYQYAKEHYDQIYILSAKYGLVKDDQVIESYEMTLNTLNREACKWWAYDVWLSLNNILKPEDEIYILAGKKYYHYLLGYIKNKCHIVMKDLPIGKRLHWLKRAINDTHKLQQV